MMVGYPKTGSPYCSIFAVSLFLLVGELFEQSVSSVAIPPDTEQAHRIMAINSSAVGVSPRRQSLARSSGKARLSGEHFQRSP